MALGYSKNKSIQILVALLKAHGINQAVVSPGNTDLEFVAALQFDKSFSLFSSVDERSGAYMACGLAGATKKPVVIACTEATASRDYYPGITEAYYRKLPILAVTGVHRYNQIGHLHSQIINRDTSPKDSFVTKVQLPIIKDEEDEWETMLLVNKAILDLTRHGGGPVHIDLPFCNFDYDFTLHTLPAVRKIERFYVGDKLPMLDRRKKTAIYIGSHRDFSEEETQQIDTFCADYDAVVFCDHTSGYHGAYAVYANLLSQQPGDNDIYKDIDVVIHLGEPAADEATQGKLKRAKEVWRISPDGELRDTFRKLTKVFEMEALQFFSAYSVNDAEKRNSYLEQCREAVKGVDTTALDIPFSNIYMAQKISMQLPENSEIHLGLSNTIRAWSMFDFSEGVRSTGNVGCRGIDGILSEAVGASLADRSKICYCVLGDLSFFYDMNALGNREIGANLRVLIINNNGGSIFKQKTAPAYIHFGDEISSLFIAASGHYGNGSKDLVRHYAEDLGFTYLAASSKEEFESALPQFLDAAITKPMVMEAFTTAEDEREAFAMMTKNQTPKPSIKSQIAKQVLGDDGVKLVKKLIGK